jgi:carbamoyl-phosphate synthase large subunit
LEPTYRPEIATLEIIDHEKASVCASEPTFGNILVTSFGGKLPLIKMLAHAIRKLGADIKIFGANLDEHCIGRPFVDEFWHMTRFENMTIESFIKECWERNISSIIPTRDGELIFSKHKEDLASAGITLMLSDSETIEICRDKYKFFQFCSSCGLNDIPTWNNPQNVPFEKFDKWVVKVQGGAGSRGIGLNILPKEAIEFSKHFKQPIFQPHIQGKEYSVDLYVNRQGNLTGCVVRERVHVVDGESQVTRVIRHVAIETLANLLNVLNLMAMFSSNVSKMEKLKNAVCLNAIHVLELPHR